MIAHSIYVDHSNKQHRLNSPRQSRLDRRKQSVDLPSRTHINQVTVRCQRPLESVGDIVSDQTFWSDIEHIDNGWISQDSRGLVAVKKVTEHRSFEALMKDLISWSRPRQFQHRVVILVARQEDTTPKTTRRLQEINKMLRQDFGAIIRLCLVTGSDLLYLRHGMT